MNSLDTHYDIFGNLVSNKKTVEKFSNSDDFINLLQCSESMKTFRPPFS